MKDWLTNPILYYVLVPLCVGLWPLSAALKYCPEMDEALQKWKNEYVEAEALIGQILDMDPDRLNFVDSSQQETAFSYAVVVDRVAVANGIGKYTLNEAARTPQGQNAIVKLEDVSIQQCTRFLSTLQMRWDKLNCTNFSLTKKKEMKDLWTVSLTLNYLE